MTEGLDALILERDALAGVVREQRQVITKMARAITKLGAAFIPNHEKAEEAGGAMEEALSAMRDAGLDI